MNDVTEKLTNVANVYPDFFQLFSHGFRMAFMNGSSGGQDNTVIHIMEVGTPLGPMFAGASAQGVCFVEFIDRVKLETELVRLCAELRAVIIPGNNAHLVQLEQELNEYFTKSRTAFGVSLHITGTDFQKTVWQELMKIPYGKTISYRQQSLAMKKPEAIRAMAAANGQNKHAILIPCHRVIGSDGGLTGYAGGISKKQWLLRHESDGAGQTLEMQFDTPD